jgi:hypothetical protein
VVGIIIEAYLVILQMIIGTTAVVVSPKLVIFPVVIVICQVAGGLLLKQNKVVLQVNLAKRLDSVPAAGAVRINQ